MKTYKYLNDANNEILVVDTAYPDQEDVFRRPRPGAPLKRRRAWADMAVLATPADAVVVEPTRTPLQRRRERLEQSLGMSVADLREVLNDLT